MYGRGTDTLEILLITSRHTQRWIIPKGNIEFHMSAHAAAAQEALEEAGAVGEVGRESLGVFHYCKETGQENPVVAEVSVFPLAVVTLLEEWQERDLRTRQWFSQSAAIDAVEEPDLKEIIRSFSP